MSVDHLALAIRLTGLSLLELWGRYVELGGCHGPPELVARVADQRAWSDREDGYLRVVATEALLEAGIPLLDPPLDQFPVCGSDATVTRLLVEGLGRLPRPPTSSEALRQALSQELARARCLCIAAQQARARALEARQRCVSTSPHGAVRRSSG